MVYIPVSEVLRQFYVFNPDYGAEDGEERKKILFYHPKTDPPDTRIQNVGFCEAVVKFSDNFTNGEAPFHEVNTEKELHVYSRFEDKFLVGAAFSKTAAAERKYFLHGGALNNVLVRSYETFRLFFGTFGHVVKKAAGSNGDGGVNGLKVRLDYFYTRYLTSLKLASIPLLDALEWISYMKVDPTNYLKAQTVVDRTLEMFPMVRRFLLLYNDRLLLHNLSKCNSPCLYRYLVQNLLPLSLRSELQPESRADAGSVFSHGKFIAGPSADSESSKSGAALKLPSVFLLRDDGRGLDEYYLIAYRAHNATLAALVPVQESSSLDTDFFHDLDATVGLPLTNLASNLVDLYGQEREELGAGSHHYIYYNAVNSALTTTINEPSPFDGRSSSSANSRGIPCELAPTLCDFRDRMSESDYFGDVVAKANGDYWVAAKKAGQRELYAVTYQKNANISDVHEEIKRFCSALFDNTFLSE